MNLSNILSQFEAAKSEIEQLKGGRKISASRARAALMKVKKESDILRREILAHSKGLPVKQRKSKTSSVLAPTVAQPIAQPAEAPAEVAQPQPIAVPKAVKTAKPRAKKDVVLSAR